MTVYLGELIDGGTHHFYFTTVDSTGLPTTLSGTPVLSVYKDANTTETTTGPAITADFDTRTGLNAVTLTLTDAFYVADTDYQVVITTGTVSGVSVVGYVVATFSIQNRGVDWGNIQRPTSTVDLSATDIQLVDTATAVTNAVTVGTMNANVINAASIATSAMDGKGDWNVGKTGYTLTQSFPSNFAAFAITAGGAITVGTNNDKTGYSISGTKTTLDALNDIAATAVVSAGAITTAAGAVVNVDLVDTCSVNSDMVGTNGALLAASAPTNFGDLAITLTTGLMSVGTNNDKADYNIASIDANAIDAASIAAGAMDGKGNWNIGKTGYTLTQGFPSNFVSMSITAGGLVDITQAAADKPWTTTTRALTDKVDFALSAAADQSIADLILPPTNTAFSDIPFLFVAASDHVTPVTGATGTAVTRSIDSAAFGAGTGTLAEVGNGMYQYDATAADVNGKIITFRFTGTGGTPGAPDDTFVTVVMSV